MRYFLPLILSATIVSPAIAAEDSPTRSELCQKFSEIVQPIPELLNDAGTFATVIRIKSQNPSDKKAATDLLNAVTAGMSEFTGGINELADMCSR